MRPDGSPASGETDGVREVTDALGPVVAVGVEPGGRAVAGFVLDDVGQRAHPEGLGVAAFDHRGIALGGAVAEGHRTEAVEGDVVDAGVDEMTLLGDTEDSAHDEPVAEHVEGRHPLGADPLDRGRFGVVLTAQVDDRGAIVEGVVDDLQRLPVDLVEPQHAGTDLAGGLCAGVGEDLGVEVALDVEVLGDRQRHIAE